jgi:hypothetical protein
VELTRIIREHQRTDWRRKTGVDTFSEGCASAHSAGQWRIQLGSLTKERELSSLTGVPVVLRTYGLATLVRVAFLLL